MQVIGIDFASRPSHRKPITALHCVLADGKLTAGDLEEWRDFEAFETALQRPGPWIAGIDFPFGQSRRFIETIGWPSTWAGYVGYAGSLSRKAFRDELERYKARRNDGDKEHRRRTDELSGSVSPQKLYGVPVGLMFFEGAPRLLTSGVSIPHIQTGDPSRIVVEAYPGILARSFIERRSYKKDQKKKQTFDQLQARIALIENLIREARTRLGFEIDAPLSLCDDPGGDHLDALLCAAQAAWAWTRREEGYGAPEGVDALEGWIADPRATEDDLKRTRRSGHPASAKPNEQQLPGEFPAK